MKGYRIFIGLFILIFVGGGTFLIYILNYKMDNNSFGDELIPYTDEANEYSHNVTVDFNGKNYKIHPSKVSDIYIVITRGSFDRKKLIFKKEFNIENLVIHFGDDYEITVMRTMKAEKGDGVIIKFKNLVKNRTKYYSLEGYKTFEHIIEIFHADGNDVHN
ncbi:MAG: hypothetical protein RR364_01830 [Lachnospiraceae bacterium]